VQKACTFVRLQEELFFLIGYIPTGNRFRPVENAVGRILLPTDPIFGSVGFHNKLTFKSLQASPDNPLAAADCSLAFRLFVSKFTTVGPRIGPTENGRCTGNNTGRVHIMEYSMAKEALYIV